MDLKLPRGRKVSDIQRSSGWFITAAIAAVVIALIAPHQLGVLVWNVCKITLAAFMGYWCDRSISPNARPADFDNESDAQQARLRRAIIIAAFVIGMGVSV